jgi:hypothetical protein
LYRQFDELSNLGLGSGQDRKLTVSSLTPPPANVSPISPSSSVGSSHATGGLASFDSRHMRAGSSSGPYSQYLDHVGGPGIPVKTSFGNQIRRTTVGGGQLSAPSLGVREGAGLLGPQGVQSALRLQASPRAAGESKKMENIKEDKRCEDEHIGEPVAGGSAGSEEPQERMVLDAPSRTHTPSPAFRSAVEEDSEGSEGSLDPELSAHRPNHSLYPLLRIEGDPALKLPALEFKGETKSPPLPSIAATVPISSLRSSASTKSGEVPSVGSLYAGLSSAVAMSASSSFHKIQDRALTRSVSPSSSGPSTSPRRPSISSVSSSSPSATGKNNVVLPSLASVILDTPPLTEEKSLGSAPASTEEISMEDRARHAALIRNLIIYVNLTYLTNQETLKQGAVATSENDGEGMEVDEDSEVGSVHRAGSVESGASVRDVSVGA